MSWWTRNLVRFGARRAYNRFSNLAKDPQAAQLRLLGQLVERNANTAFGKDHGFDSIASPSDFAARVPVRDYEALRPYMRRVIDGEPEVLTAERPLAFAKTSGTTAEPKLVPVTPSWLRELRNLTRIWIHRAVCDHPRMFDGAVVTFVDLAVESRTEQGMPIGSVSGMTSERVPWVIRRHQALPRTLAAIGDYDARYEVAARMALAQDVSSLVSVNPTTLLRIGDVCAARGEDIVAAIRDGRLGLSTDPDAEQALRETLGVTAKPDPRRAARLAACMETAGRLRPVDAWPNLAFIGCWLGGSCGVFARRLTEQFGDAPKRDLGFRSTEATFTVPLQDESDAGVLSVGANFYEFVRADDDSGRVLLAHELSEGERYRVLFSTRGGLYRYDICDIVEVRGFYHNTPLVAFVHKGKDMVNITGEKLHARQIARAAESASVRSRIDHVQVQIIPDVDACRYDLLVELPGDEPVCLNPWARAFEQSLEASNIEYRAKRASGRLGACRIRRMRSGWSERQRRADVEQRGKRDSQYKWPFIRHAWDDATRSELHSPSAVERILRGVA